MTSLFVRTGLFHLALLACAQFVGAQSAAPAIDNESVKVSQMVLEPGGKRQWGDYERNRVLIALGAGRESLTGADGKRTERLWKAGEARWMEAHDAYVSENIGRQRLALSAVELKSVGTPAPVAKRPRAPLAVDPKHYSLVFENNQVRVTRVQIGPLEKTPLHEHALDRVVIYVTNQSFRIRPEGGKPEAVTHKAGDLGWAGPITHTEENVSDKPFEAVVVEIKK